MCVCVCMQTHLREPDKSTYTHTWIRYNRILKDRTTHTQTHIDAMEFGIEHFSIFFLTGRSTSHDDECRGN